jgi:myo-inositol 2-dehydrogenase/D-chiro-inositol 1-dehydrogenase
VEHQSPSRLSRREFVKSAAMAAAATSAFPRFAQAAPNDKPLTVGLVGCGGRGTKAAQNAVDAADHVRVVALADIAEDRLDNCRKKLKEKRQIEVADKNCFIGFDAYQKVLHRLH